MASAILLDATVIRMVLVPATMSLLGERNWWVPGWLDRVLPTVRAEVQDHDPALSATSVDPPHHDDFEHDIDHDINHNDERDDERQPVGAL